MGPELPIESPRAPATIQMTMLASFTAFGVSQDGGALRSINGGVSWTDSVFGLPAGVQGAARCASPTDANGVVDAADLAELLPSWGPCPGCPADFNGDGIVDAADLAEVLAAWGRCE